MRKWANVGNNGARELAFVLFDGRDNAEHNGVGFVEISEIFTKQDAFFCGTGSFDGVYDKSITLQPSVNINPSPGIATLQKGIP